MFELDVRNFSNAQAWTSYVKCQTWKPFFAKASYLTTLTLLRKTKQACDCMYSVSSLFPDLTVTQLEPISFVVKWIWTQARVSKTNPQITTHSKNFKTTHFMRPGRFLYRSFISETYTGRKLDTVRFHKPTFCQFVFNAVNCFWDDSHNIIVLHSTINGIKM